MVRFQLLRLLSQCSSAARMGFIPGKEFYRVNMNFTYKVNETLTVNRQIQNTYSKQTNTKHIQ